MSQKMQIPFFRPDLGADEIREVVHSLENGWITTGPKTRQFEENFARWLLTGKESGAGDKALQTIGVNSATAGLHLALEAMGIGEGDEVIVPVMTFTASAEVVRYLGADPVFVDMDPVTLNLDTSRLEAAVSARTKAVIVVHFAGLAVDMDPVFALAKKHDLRVLEDAAHALPTSWKGQKIGTLQSDAAVFSFYATKTITTGEGGMIVTRDPDLAARCRVMRLHGIDRDAFDRYRSKKAAWRYDIVAPGYKYNMTDVAASLGLHQLNKADAYQKRRRKLAMRYNQGLAELPLILPPDAPEGDTHAWHLYVVRLASGAGLDRDSFIDALFAAGVSCSVHFIPLHQMSYWKERYDLTADMFPGAEKYFEACATLPLFPGMRDEEVDYVVEVCQEIFTNLNKG